MKAVTTKKMVIVNLSVFAVLYSTLFGVRVFAAVGGGSSSGYSCATGYRWCATITGAKWEKKAYDGPVTIPYYQNNYITSSWISGGTITCPSSAEYYYRYGYVAADSNTGTNSNFSGDLYYNYYHYSYTANGYYYNFYKGDLIGLPGVGCAVDWCRSTQLGGSEVYAGGESWSSVTDAFSRARNVDGAAQSYSGWDESKKNFTPTADISWFCYSDKDFNVNVYAVGVALDDSGNVASSENLNGGSSVSGSPYSVKWGDKKMVPERIDSFDGYDYDYCIASSLENARNGNCDLSTGSSYELVVSENTDIYLRYKKKKYTLTVNYGVCSPGWTELQPTFRGDYTYGETGRANVPSTLEKNGNTYVFDSTRYGTSGTVSGGAFVVPNMTENIYVDACYKEASKYTLAGVPVDTNGNRISTISGVTSEEVQSGGTASITRSAPSEGYEFVGWKSSDWVDLGSGNTYSKTLTKNEFVYMVYEKKPEYTLTVNFYIKPCIALGDEVYKNGSVTSEAVYAGESASVSLTPSLPGYLRSCSWGTCTSTLRRTLFEDEVENVTDEEKNCTPPPPTIIPEDEQEWYYETEENTLYGEGKIYFSGTTTKTNGPSVSGAGRIFYDSGVAYVAGTSISATFRHTLSRGSDGYPYAVSNPSQAYWGFLWPSMEIGSSTSLSLRSGRSGSFDRSDTFDISSFNDGTTIQYCQNFSFNSPYTYLYTQTGTREGVSTRTRERIETETCTPTYIDGVEDVDNPTCETTISYTDWSEWSDTEWSDWEYDDPVYYGVSSEGTRNSDKACISLVKTSTFKGKTTVVGAETKDTNWVPVNVSSPGYTETGYLNSRCNDGCSVSFRHDLERIYGNGKSAYTIRRYLYNLSSGTIIENSVSEGFSKSGGTYTIKTGEAVCEELAFQDDTARNHISKAKACAYAIGEYPSPSGSNDPTPDNKPTGSSTYVDIKIKDDESSAAYRSWRDDYVYAKPTDRIDFMGTYYPYVQQAYNVRSSYTDGVPNNGRTVGQMVSGWNNAFSLDYESLLLKNKIGTRGVSSTLSETVNDGYIIKVSDVGTETTAYAQTNSNNATKITPKSVSFSWGGASVGTRATVDKSAINDTAIIRVPYNFIVDTRVTSPTIEEAGDDPSKAKYIYAGEKTEIKFEIDVKPKTNCETTSDCGEYATKVDEAEWKIIVYRWDGDAEDGSDGYGYGKDTNLCSYFGLSNNEKDCGYGYDQDRTGTLNSMGDMNGKSGERKEATFYAQDLPAGTQICVASAVYPANSGSDTNWKDKEGNHKWRISDSKCYKIAKKPSLQAWGGNVYAGGNLNTGLSVKKYLIGYNYSDSDSRYIVSSSNLSEKEAYVFGSWGELGVIGSSIGDTFGSGAELGYSGFNPLVPNQHPSDGAGNNANAPRDPGGGRSKTLLNSLKLFISSGKIVENNKSSVVGHLINSAIGASEEQDIQYSNASNVGGMEIGAKQLYIVNGGSSVTINGNIIYDDNESESGYKKLEDLPKVVIYSRGNILIDCSVTRIDAVLIAEGEVVTCGKDGTSLDAIKSGINDRYNSEQLVVNGAIIAKKLIANRTYGAATGANSIVPAEIINFDPTLYLWGGRKTAGLDSEKLTITYQKELSPRY